jgi:hypothetical protein
VSFPFFGSWWSDARWKDKAQPYTVFLYGTGFYYSDNVTSEKCLVKKRKNGKESYYQQMYAAAFVHPDQTEVIPVFPEMITNGDGTKKQDCERNATHRFFKEFRREHPHIKVIVVEDALASNGQHIQELQRLDLRYILGAKPGDHKFLFEQVGNAEKREEVMEFRHSDRKQPHIEHCYRFINLVPLNKANKNLLVNFSPILANRQQEGQDHLFQLGNRLGNYRRQRL